MKRPDNAQNPSLPRDAREPLAVVIMQAADEPGLPHGLDPDRSHLCQAEREDVFIVAPAVADLAGGRALGSERCGAGEGVAVLVAGLVEA